MSGETLAVWNRFRFEVGDRSGPASDRPGGWESSEGTASTCTRPTPGAASGRPSPRGPPRRRRGTPGAPRRPLGTVGTEANVEGRQTSGVGQSRQEDAQDIPVAPAGTNFIRRRPSLQPKNDAASGLREMEHVSTPPVPGREGSNEPWTTDTLPVPQPTQHNLST